MSNSLNHSAIKAKAYALAEEIHAVTPDLQIFYVIHEIGQLKHTLHIMEDAFLEHPAGSIAVTLASRPMPAHESSMFHGLCLKQLRGPMGLGGRTEMLAVVSLNIGHYDDFFNLTADLYRLSWQALEMAALLRAQPPERIPDRPINIKRSVLGETRVNLRADIFSVLFLHGEGHDDALIQLAYARSYHVLTRNPGHTPDRYCFPLVAEITSFALRDTLPNLSKDKPRLEQYSQLTTELDFIVTNEQLRLWGRLSELSQDMAWRGYKPETIAGAAIHASEDAFLKSIMHKVTDYTRITPQDLEQLKAIYNSFIGLDANRGTHLVMIEHAFDTALLHAMKTGSSYPFFEMAEKQNLDLLQGRFMGWCAGALQSAGNVFHEAGTMGISPAHAAKIEFDGQSHLPALPALYKLTREIITARNKGQILHLDDLSQLTRKQNDVELLSRSVEITLANQSQARAPEPPPVDDEIEMVEVPHDENLMAKITQQTLYERGSISEGIVPKERIKPDAPPEFVLEED